MKESWMKTFVKEQELYAQHASCADIYVSALIIDESVPTAISHGYNGTPKGIIHCEELDVMIREFSEKFSQSELKNFLSGKNTVTDDCLKSLPAGITRYTDKHYIGVVYRQIEQMINMPVDEYKKLPVDVAVRLANNYVHYKWEIHAEVNALNKLKFIDLSDERFALMVNYSPCFECAKNIISRGMKKVYYQNEWIDPRWNQSSLELLRISGLTVEHY